MESGTLRNCNSQGRREDTTSSDVSLGLDPPAVLGLRIAKDLATVGSGTAAATILGTIAIFVVPRLVSVEDFGYWRLFLLYSGYMGLLHFGFADGALLAWVGKPSSTIRHDLRPSIKFVSAQQVGVFLLGTLLCVLLFPARLWLVGIAVLAFAVLLNVTAVLVCALQAAREFRTVAAAVAIPTGAFLALALIFRSAADYRILVLSYLLSWIALLFFLWSRLRPLQDSGVSSAWTLGRQFITSGWPIMLSNFAFVIVQSADRLVVSATSSIYSFAQYSLAASVMSVPIIAIAAVSRVFFPHLAVVEHRHHRKTYGGAQLFAFLLWSQLVPYYFLLEGIVRRFLPKYVDSLPYAAILLCGSIFLGSVQVLQLSFSNLYGHQRRFFGRALIVVGTSFPLALGAALWLHSLRAVAASQVISVLVWWCLNEWDLRDISGENWRDWTQLMAIVLGSVVSLWLASSLANNMFVKIVAYYAIVWVIVASIAYREIRVFLKMAIEARQGAVNSAGWTNFRESAL
jgi:O-antigen/teichoic acid export membrane protein